MKTLKIFMVALVSLLTGGIHQEARGQGCNPVLTSVNILNRSSYCMTNAGDQVKMEIQWAMSTNDLTCVAPTNSWAIKIDMPTSLVYRVTSLADIVIGGPFTWTYDGFNNSLRGVNNVPIAWGMSGKVEVMLKGNSPLYTNCADLGTVVNIQIIANPPAGNGSTANFDNDTGDDSGIFSLEIRQPMIVSTLPIAACYATEAAALAAAMAATTVTTTCLGTVTKTAVKTGADCAATIMVTAVNDCGNTQSVAYSTRIDDTAPVITTGTIAACYPTVASAESAALAATTATDNCPGTIMFAASTAGDCSAVITVTATDGCGKISSTTYTTRIDDTEPVVSSIPNSGATINGYTCGNVDPVVVNTDLNLCTATRSIVKPLWMDNCIVTVTSTATSVVALTDFNTYVSGTFPVGITLVTFNGTDGCGNIGNCVLKLEVKDMQFPTITGCPSNIIVTAPDNACTKIVTWTAPTFFDNCSFTVVETSSPTAGLTSGSAFPVGTSTSIKYDVTDPSGNTTTCQFTVTVNGTCNPPTEFTTTFVIESSGFLTGQSRTGVYTVDNIGGSANTSPVQILISVPETSFSSGTGPLNRIPTVDTSVTLFGNTFMSNNGDWDYDLTNYPFIICTLKTGKVINPGQSSILAITFNAAAITGSTGQTTGQLLFGTAGDQNFQNNFAQSTFLIN